MKSKVLYIAILLAFFLFQGNSIAQVSLWDKSFKDVKSFNIAADAKNASFDKKSDKGESLMRFLRESKASGPRLPLGEVASTSEDAIYFCIRGNDDKNNVVLSISVIELKGNLIVLSILKTPEELSKLKDLLYFFDRNKWPDNIFDLKNLQRKSKRGRGQ